MTEYVLDSSLNDGNMVGVGNKTNDKSILRDLIVQSVAIRDIQADGMGIFNSWRL